MPPALPKGTRFIVPASGKKKYVALVPVGDRLRRVGFGDRDYEHYRDAVPAALGGQRWAHKNHLDPARRADYRRRHGAIRSKTGSPSVRARYSAAWFSYHFLW